MHLPNVLQTFLSLRLHQTEPIPEFLQLPNAEVASSDAHLQFLPHDSLEDFSDDCLPHLLLLAQAKALYILLKGHGQEEKAENLVVMQLSHV